jgi:polysaccharide deacetylase 2 family uncharacterized protein YibQ
MRGHVKSFRPLLYFWAAILGILALGAITLQMLGAPGALPAKPEPPLSSASAPLSPRPPAPKPAPAVEGIADPDLSLLEQAPGLPGRMLPRISESGRTPAQAYAAAFDKTERHPRIALVIDGIGLDRALGEQALHTLPPSIDIAFSVYAVPQAIEALGQEARRQGRECLVSIPMEPSGFPVVEEGDKSLLTGGIPQQNRLNLDWALSSVQGCVGATGGSDGMAGERFAESRQAFGEVLAQTERRGLLYLDPRPGAPPPDDAAQGDSLPKVVDVVVDRPASPDEPASADMIDKNLAALEKIASEHGSAIGLAGPPRSVLLERLAVWANGLAARGMVLAPLTAIPPRTVTPDGPP